jgi:hypothetical protein
MIDLATYLSGYFAGKKAGGVALSKDEKAFLNFDRWISQHHGFKKHPSRRLIVMWPYGGMNSAENFLPT